MSHGCDGKCRYGSQVRCLEGACVVFMLRYLPYYASPTCLERCRRLDSALPIWQTEVPGKLAMRITIWTKELLTGGKRRRHARERHSDTKRWASSLKAALGLSRSKPQKSNNHHDLSRDKERDRRCRRLTRHPWCRSPRIQPSHW